MQEVQELSIVRNKKFTLIALAVMAFIFIQSAMPADLSKAESGTIVTWILQTFHGVLPDDRETASFIVRKTAHFTEYLILGTALLPAVKEWRTSSSGEQTVTKKNCLTAWLAGILYAVTDEIHQCFVPGRSCELRDMCIDSAGVLAGVLIVALILRNRGLRSSGSRTEARFRDRTEI